MIYTKSNYKSAHRYKIKIHSIMIMSQPTPPIQKVLPPVDEEVTLTKLNCLFTWLV